MWKVPVTDRTRDDVEYARQHAGQKEPCKGAQNSADWNRLVQNLCHIAGELESDGYTIPLPLRATWPQGHIPERREITAIRDAVFALRYQLYGLERNTWEEWAGRSWEEIDGEGRFAGDYFSRLRLPDLPYTHYEKINALEEWAQRLCTRAAGLPGCFCVAGSLVSGQATVLPRYIEVRDCRMMWAEWEAPERSWAAIDGEGRAARRYFDGCYNPDNAMTAAEWDALGRRWVEIDAEGRRAEDYFKRVIL